MSREDGHSGPSVAPPGEVRVSAREQWVVLSTLIGGMLLVDYATPWALRESSDWIQAVVLGICIGQLNLIAIWAALGPGNIVLRLPWSVLLTVFMWYALVLGLRRWGRVELDDAVLLGVVLLGAAVVLQIPLWIASRSSGWRLTAAHLQGMPAKGEQLQFELRHMLIGMAILSAALAPARTVLPPGSLENLVESGWSWAPVTVGLVVNLAVVVPCIWLAFLRPKIAGQVALGWLAYVAAVTGLEVLVFIAVWRAPVEARLFMMYFILNVLQCATVIGVLLVLRLLGWRLERCNVRR